MHLVAPIYMSVHLASLEEHVILFMGTGVSNLAITFSLLVCVSAHHHGKKEFM